jgi:hypothetical protein
MNIEDQISNISWQSVARWNFISLSCLDWTLQGEMSVAFVLAIHFVEITIRFIEQFCRVVNACKFCSSRFRFSVNLFTVGFLYLITRLFPLRTALIYEYFYFYHSLWLFSPARAMVSSSTTFLNHTQQSVGLLWTSDQNVAETSIWQHTTHTTDRHPSPRRDSNLRSQQASGRRPTP